IVLADDHATVRQGLRALLASVEGLEVVDEVGDTESALASVLTFAPDLLILDLSMPTGGGLETLRRLARERVTTAVVVLTRYRDPAFVHEAMAAGATAYVLKQSPFAEVQRALAHAVRGERYVDPAITAATPRITFDPARQVSRRESEVLRHAAL